jgi:signal transduction histidine kinase
MDGTRLIVRESAAVVRDEHGKPLYYEGTVEDITDRKNAEEKLIAYQHQLRSLALDLALSEEHIRRQVAMNMHDYLGQNLAISKIKLDSLRQLVTSQKKADILDEVRTLLGSTIDSVRSLTFELSPPVLYELGFEAAVEWLVRYIGKRDGMLTDFHNDGKLKSLEDNVRILLFQSVREAIINVTKHAHAKKMSVSITRDGHNIQIFIVDDGIGFDVSKVRLLDEKSHAFGLLSIRERIGYIGGRFEIQSAPGKGTRVLLSAPVGKKSTKKRGNKNE